MKKMKSVSAAVCFILLCLGWMYISAREAESTPQAYPGVPAAYSAESDVDNYVIHQIVDDGNYLYVLFDEHNGIVAVYDLVGNYQHTLSFYAHLNGIFRIAAEEDVFYVQDKRNNLYLFRDGQFCEYLSKKDLSEELMKMDFTQNSRNYEIRDGSVWRVAGEEELCVLYRPNASVVHQSNSRLAAGLIVIVLFGVVGMIRRRSRKYR